MTTAHRPTWNSARAEASDFGNWSTGGVASWNLQARDMPHHRELKYRKGSQLSTFDRTEAKGLLEEREGLVLVAGAAPKKIEPNPQLLLQNEVFDKDALRDKYDDEDDDDSGDDDDDDSSSSSEDDEDDEVALQLELEKIKKEREEERARKEAEEEADAQAARDAAALTNNPLLNQPSSSSSSSTTTGGGGFVKRKWNDDVVFRNQARGVKEPKKQFINDTIRNDFHRRFLSKYVQ